MATTSAFGWETPDDTDLVKDGAAAIRTLGNSIDTSMSELKGGTTGQVLSKTSNTDMDFTWVAQDDSNAIQNAIVDAKGDLIAATAADTPARLAVGTNFAFLQADSSTATGLLWNNAAWTSFTPTVTPATGTGFTMSGSGFYTRVGKLCIFNFTAIITTNGTGAGSINVTFPFTARASTGWAMGQFRDNGVTGTTGNVVLANTGSVNMTFPGNLYPGVNGAVLQGTVTYEVA